MAFFSKHITLLLKRQWMKEKAAWQRLRQSPLRPLKNSSGISMMVAISALMLIMYLAMEISYESNVEYTVNAQNFNRIKAYYAAKSGLDIALLRIKIYQKVKTQFGEQLGSNSSMLDQIWSFPFAWPLPVSEELNAVDKDTMADASKESFMDANYITTIEDEGSKIDLNDLVSKSKVLRENARRQLLAIFETEKKQNEEFDRKHGDIVFGDLVNQIADFISDRRQSFTGGDKVSPFQELNTQAQAQIFPPNRTFRSLTELRFIPLMNDDLYELLEKRVTIYGMKGINPNLASKEVIRSLDPGITAEAADEIIKRRTDPDLGGPYQNAEDFWNYAESKGARLEAQREEIPLIFDSITNFRIRSSGEFGGAAREITAIVMDLDSIALKVAEQIKAEAKESQGSSDASPGSNPATKKPTPKIPKGPPRIVWWSEK